MPDILHCSRGVTQLKKGDEVYARPNIMHDGYGGYAEYVVAKETETALKPKSIDHVHAATIPVAAVTAWRALFDTAGLQQKSRSGKPNPARFTWHCGLAASPARWPRERVSQMLADEVMAAFGGPESVVTEMAGFAGESVATEMAGFAHATALSADHVAEPQPQLF